MADYTKLRDRLRMGLAGTSDPGEWTPAADETLDAFEREVLREAADRIEEHAARMYGEKPPLRWTFDTYQGATTAADLIRPDEGRQQ